MDIVQIKRRALRDMAVQLGRPIEGDCRIRATNDVEAMERWLDEYFDKPTTFRSYKKEAERFLIWCALARSTNLSSLNRDDVSTYMEFLKNPSPKEIWCGPRRKKVTKGEGAWYPFAGPLSESAIRTATTILNSMMSYLVEARYLNHNPFSLVRKKNRFNKNVEEQSLLIKERILLKEEWIAIIQSIDALPSEHKKQAFKKERLRFLVTVLFFLGLRIDELARATWNDCRKLNGRWWFFVRGKGDRLGKVPINSHLLKAIIDYRHALGKSPIPQEDDHAPLIVNENHGDQGLSGRQMSNLLKDLGKMASSRFEEGTSSHMKLLKFSPHWLRHLSASMQDLAGISFTNIKSNLRHLNEQTTRLYVHSFDDDRHEDMEKLKILPPR